MIIVISILNCSRLTQQPVVSAWNLCNWNYGNELFFIEQIDNLLLTLWCEINNEIARNWWKHQIISSNWMRRQFRLFKLEETTTTTCFNWNECVELKWSERRKENLNYIHIAYELLLFGSKGYGQWLLIFTDIHIFPNQIQGIIRSFSIYIQYTYFVASHCKCVIQSSLVLFASQNWF